MRAQRALQNRLPVATRCWAEPRTHAAVLTHGLIRRMHTRPSALNKAALLALAVGASACASHRQAGPEFAMGPQAAMARARADSLRYPYTKADIDFMSGMIHHHAQAISISRWAPSHQASPAVQRLTARIINAQTDEITIMRTWFGDRNQPMPTVDSTGKVTMGAMAHGMPGHDMSAMGNTTPVKRRRT